jgi:CheY-like chemotaxis protein
MPTGGQIVLCTENRIVDAYAAQCWEAQPGQYVVVKLSDTGSGMSAEILKHVFEPFFTTKEIGRGTGLGLSQVYGFAKQCGGFVSISSEVGGGTEVAIHLPRTDPPKAVASPAPSTAKRVEGTARILVVEDDSAVRAVTSEMLRDLGYTVFQADNGRAALDAIASQPIDLVFSDVILPDGLNGVDLAREVQAIAQNTQVLLTSGYTAQRLNLLGKDERLSVLHKPYNETQLSEAISAALSASDS